MQASVCTRAGAPYVSHKLRGGACCPTGSVALCLRQRLGANSLRAHSTAARSRPSRPFKVGLRAYGATDMKCPKVAGSLKSYDTPSVGKAAERGIIWEVSQVYPSRTACRDPHTLENLVNSAESVQGNPLAIPVYPLHVARNHEP